MTPRLVTRPWVQGLALSLAVVLAFGANLEGGLVWDDEHVIGAAAALASPLDAFRTDLFGTGRGVGAVYYRPLVTLSYWVDVHVFRTAPNVGMHLVNLVWHAIASVLVLRALRRWLGPDRGLLGDAACFAAALYWALSPHKAENVAWITGRGDVIGTALALGGLELAARARTSLGRAGAAAVATLIAILCKEAMVAVPALFLAEALLRRAPLSRVRDHLRGALADPAVLASLGVSLVYLAFRRFMLPIASGGEGMLAAIPRSDTALLFLETTGTAAIAVVTPWRSVLLREPIAFDGPARLVHAPVLAAIGALTWLLCAAAFVRFPRARGPLTVTLGTFLPISNLIPAGLEARLSERFLYMPTIGLAWGLAWLLSTPKLGRHATAAVLVAAIFLGFRASRRAALFASSDRLFGWEAVHGDGAIAVFDNAAKAAARARRYREARDLYLRTVERYRQLGFTGEGFGEVVEAARSQVWATEDTHPASLSGYEALARALLEGRAGVAVVELEGDRKIGVPTDSAEAAIYLASYRKHLELSLGRVLARTQRADEATAIAERLVAGCPDCRPVLVGAIEIALSAGRPDLGDAWAASLPAEEPRRETYQALLQAQRSLAGGNDPRGRALAWFVGGAFRNACAEGTSFDTAREAAEVRLAIAASCRLAADDARLQLVTGGDDALNARVAALADPLRFDDGGRLELARAATAPR